ncbi:nacht domain protein [Colletotrichum tabaci]|uniref:Nacht domain protein n=1 Tax=Colletotrichum tabaci TaxID=1209068 RepID=A0AAV9TQX9_9PEZI
MASPAVVDAFESAKKDFLSQFPNSTTYDFASFPTIDDVYRAAEKLQDQQATTRTMRNMRKIEPFLETLRHYGGVVDTFVQVKPDVLALIWGPIKFLLLISSTFHAIYDKILSAMDVIGNALPTFQNYVDLFPRNNKMHLALCLFYRDILDFYATLLDFFKHSKWSARFRALWPKCLGRLDIVIRNIAQHKTLLNEEATLANMIQAQADRDSMLKSFESQYEFQIRQDFEAVMGLLSPRLYDEDLERFRRTANLKSGDWLQEHDHYKEWSDVQNRSCRVLWLQGIPGAGKTFLSSSVVRRLSEENRRVASVFISYKFLQDASALKLLHSLIAQFVLDEKDLRQLLISAYNDNYRQLNSSLIFSYVDDRALSWVEEVSATPAQAGIVKPLMKAIAQNSQGMFLYARLLCDSMMQKGDIDAVKEAIHDLPVGLDEAYARIISRIEGFDELERKETQQILSMTAASEVPLSKNEIQLGVVVTRGGKVTQGCRHIFPNILRRCGPIVEEVDGYSTPD